MHPCVWLWACHNIHVEIKGQHWGITSLLLLCLCYWLNSVLQAWQQHLHTVSYCPGSMSISLYASTLFSLFSFSFFLSLSDLVLCLEQRQNDHPQQNPLCLCISIYIAESNVIVYRLCAHCQTDVTDVETSINQVTITDFCSMWTSCSLYMRQDLY